MKLKTWQFAYILPNLSIKQAIGNEYVAISPSNDQRIQNIIQKYPIIHQLVNSFSDQFNRKVNPNILIYRSDIPLVSLQNGALIDFRNIISICSAVTAWQNFIIRGQWFIRGQYSEYFSLYPVTPSKTFDNLIIRSPAVLGIDQPNKFSGQTAPELAGPAYEIECDQYLFTALIEIWRKRYINGRLSDLKTNILFRSLQIANQACAIPDTNYPSIYDYGARLAQWVSAYEILAHPRNENVGQYNVLNLIGQFPSESRSLRYRRYIILKSRNKGDTRGTLFQKLCHQIYDARHDFLHGNPVSYKNIYPWHNHKRYPLNFFAPIIYKLILICFLGIYPSNGIYLPTVDFKIYRSIRGLEDALIKSTVDISEKRSASTYA